MNHAKDNITLGALIGFILPLIGVSLFGLAMLNQFDSVQHMIDHFQLFDVWYKVLSLALMPGAGLFFLWSKSGKMNQARAVLMMTLFYGVFVMILYFG